jgi:hypothetical protein
MTKPSKNPRRPKRCRSELERLVDLTVLGQTHPELGACWLFTGVTTPYGRIAKAQDSYAHRLGWKLLRGPIPEGKELHHRGVYACWNPEHLEPVTHAENQTSPAQDALQTRPSAVRRQSADQPERDASLPRMQRGGSASVFVSAQPLGWPERSIGSGPLLAIPHSIRYVNFPCAGPLSPALWAG